MTEQVPAPVAPQSPTNSIEESRRVINALTARIFDTQKRSGFFLVDEAGDVMMEDFSEFFADLHLKVARAYEAYKHGALISGGEADISVSVLLIDSAITCLGLCKRLGRDVGKMMLDIVIAQAREAAEVERFRAEEERAAAEPEAIDDGSTENQPPPGTGEPQT